MTNIKQVNKKNNVIKRLHSRTVNQSFPCQKDKDVCVIDATLNALYNQGDKQTKRFRQEILKPNHLKLNEPEAERIWDILVSTGLVSPVIGFGNSGKLNLTNAGYQLMRQHGSYSGFLSEIEKQKNPPIQQQQGFIFPQFIIETEDEKNSEEQKDSNAEENDAVAKL